MAKLAVPNSPVQSGTRVGSPQIGTLRGPKQAPTVTQYGVSTPQTIPNAEPAQRGPRWWPRNALLAILAPAGDRSSQITTDHELQTGPTPGKIPRLFNERMRGSVWENGSNAFPATASFSIVPHTQIPRRAQTASAYGRKYFDDDAIIPALYAGSPRQ
jgi:hypothetical protein